MSVVKLPTFLVPEFEEDDVTERQTTRQSPSPGSPESFVKVNELKTSTEQFLYNSWKEADIVNKENKERIEKLELDLKRARLEIDQLKETISASTNITTISSRSSNTSKTTQAKTYSQPGWEEEEEIVAQETAWILPKQKKRKFESRESPDKLPGNLIKSTANNNKSVLKKNKPPPVIMSNVQEYSKIKEALKSKNLNFKANLMNNNQLKLNVDTEQEYRDLTKVMNEAKYQWHTYENKQTRPIRVMAKDLHPSCDPDDIKNDLINKGFQIIEVVNKLKKYKKDDKEFVTRLPMFMLTFQNTEDIKKIYQIQHICHMKVKIEAIKSNKLIPQCKRCQRYGHTQKYCQHEAVCVKCAGKHITSECTKSKNIPPKCSNCAESHPANYRGCLVAKELQKRRINAGKQQDQRTNEKSVAKEQRHFDSKKVSNATSYAGIVKPTANSHEQEPNKKEQPNVMQLLHDILNNLTLLSGRIDNLEAKSQPAGTNLGK
jgi:hypothetical protein